jgi:hypothetical protein
MALIRSMLEWRKALANYEATGRFALCLKPQGRSFRRERKLLSDGSIRVRPLLRFAAQQPIYPRKGRKSRSLDPEEKVHIEHRIFRMREHSADRNRLRHGDLCQRFEYVRSV